MRRRPFRKEPRLRWLLTALLNGLKKVAKSGRIVARARGVLEAHAVGLALLFPAVPLQQGAEGGVGPGLERDRSERVQRDVPGAADMSKSQSDLCQRQEAGLLQCRLPLLLDRLVVMTERDVADFVAEHASQRGLVAHERQRAAGDEHVAARRREGVDLVGVEDAEVVVEVGTVGLDRHRVADQRDIAGEWLIAEQRVARAECRGDGPTELDFLRLVDVRRRRPRVRRVHASEPPGHAAENRTGDTARAAPTLATDQHQDETDRAERECPARHRAPPVLSPGSFRKASICGPSGWCASTQVTMP